ncbi:ATP-binding cassette domain-containing protein, partial [Actinomyces gerencseriae]|uniref:ATP-binding cassette domain-containing protein n=1 Tax=Actinomyces gerencseriae TaxID=52769 RepID=UPI003C6C141E
MTIDDIAAGNPAGAADDPAPDTVALDEDAPLLRIEDLEVAFRSSTGLVPAVRRANLTIHPGQSVAIVGESGSGKSTLANAVIGLLPGTGRVTGGRILFDGEDIAHASGKRMRRLRGSEIGMVPQDPMTNLNPVWSIGFQVRETLRANGLAGVADDRLAIIAAA